jgi:integrase
MLRHQQALLPSPQEATMKRRGFGMVYQRGKVWWVKYHFRGKVYRETSRSLIRMDAIKLLRKRMAEMGTGQLLGPTIDRTTFTDLETIITHDYTINARRSLGRMKTSLTALRAFFGLSLALDITLDRLNAYVAERMSQQIAPATIKNDLSILRRAFRLAQRAGKAICPPFPTLSINNTRQGFFERQDFEAVRLALPLHLRPVVTFAYLTGWRIRTEIQSLTWRQVDMDEGIVRLEPGSTKNEEGRVLPFAVLPELRELLEVQRQDTTQLELERGAIVPWVFHRNGQPIIDFRKAWANACTAAGVAKRIPHDFRRTAVRNLERAGVPRSVAMKITGHKTESVYRRYAIVSEADLSEGMKKLAALHARDRRRSSKKGLGTVWAQNREVDRARDTRKHG